MWEKKRKVESKTILKSKNKKISKSDIVTTPDQPYNRLQSGNNTLVVVPTKDSCLKNTGVNVGLCW